MTAKKAEDFGAWYQEIVVEAELISYYDVSGTHPLGQNHDRPFTVLLQVWLV